MTADENAEIKRELQAINRRLGDLSERQAVNAAEMSGAIAELVAVKEGDHRQLRADLDDTAGSVRALQQWRDEMPRPSRLAEWGRITDQNRMTLTKIAVAMVSAAGVGGAFGDWIGSLFGF